MVDLEKYTIVFKDGKPKRPMPGMSDEGVEMIKFNDTRRLIDDFVTWWYGHRRNESVIHPDEIDEYLNQLKENAVKYDH